MSDEFWITNISDRNVTLPDLGYSFPAKRSVNLLGKNFSFTREQLEKSLKEGSLSKRANILKLRTTPPPKVSPYFVKKEVSKDPIYTAHMNPRSMVKIENPKFDEFEQNDTDFIDDFTSQE